MNRFFKYSLVISIIIVLIAGLIISAITLYNPNAYKPLITQWVKDEKKRELKINGDIRLTLHPQFGLNISQLSLSEYDSHAAFAHIKEFQLSLSLWRLLNKQLVVDKLSIQGLDATLIRYADGRINIDDLLPTEDDSPTLEFDIEQIHINNTALIFRDEKGLRNYVLSSLNLTANDITNTSLNNLKLHVLGDTKLFKENDSNHVEVQLTIPNLQFSANHIVSDQINLIAKVTHLENSINGAFSLSNIASTSNHFTSDMMTIELAAEKDSQIINLFFNSPLSGDFDAQELQLSDLELNLRIFQPQVPDIPISGNLQGELIASNTSGCLQAKVLGNLEDSLIKAEFNLSDFNEPALQFMIDIDQFNLNHYLPFAQQKHQPTKKDQDPTNRLNKMLDLASLANLDVNGTLHIGSFQSNDISFSDIHLEIQTSDGQIQTNQTE